MPSTPTRTAPSPSPAPAPARRSGPAQAMHALGLVTATDLALHLPLRWEDETRVRPIAGAPEGEPVQVEAEVVRAQVEQRSRRQLVVQVRDDSGTLRLRFLHFYPSHQKTFQPGVRLRLRGEVRGGGLWAGEREMVHPTFKVVQPGDPLPDRLTPVYPASAGLPQAYLRKAIDAALQRAPLDELLPPGLLPAHWPALRDALLTLHRPEAGVPVATLADPAHPAWQRLKFEELLAQQVAQQLARAERSRLNAPVMAVRGGGLHAALHATLPFALTAAQRRVADEIAADLGRAVPMHRLLQGDVGSGKTVVAALAAAVAIDAGWQCALMAPTELLAAQHLTKLAQWLEPLGVTVAWLTGSRKGRARERALAAVADGSAGLVVGTQAVIQEGVQFRRLGLAVVDEQHRFGVEQRLALRRKLAEGPDGAPRTEPHLLMMSATPIPRTLAMSYLADLDVSTIDELPPGRTPIATRLFADTRRDEVIQRIRDEIAAGRQVYWVCPLIEENPDAEASAPPGRAPREQALRNVTDTHAELSAALPDTGVGLLHGRLAARDKAEVMARFADGTLRLLVATTVIEVGVDVPAASLMVIEHAERFGLAQLHQLRGRVGRGAVASVCVLLYSPPLSDTGKQRLRALAETTDGFEIARRDLEIRGPGEFLGARQSGDALLRFADLAEDGELLTRARAVAAELLARHPAVARAQVQRWMRGRVDLLKA